MKYCIISFIEITFFLSISTFSQGQNVKHKFDRINVQQGLAQSTVNHIIQDSAGFLWVATFNGIGRYDGQGFKNIYHDPEKENGLNNNGCIYLHQDRAGKIWIVNFGEYGIDKYDPVLNTFQNYHHDPDDNTSLSHNSEKHILEDSNGDIWICTENALNLLVEENGKTSFKRFPFSENIKGSPYLYESKNNVYFLLNMSKNLVFDKRSGTYTEINSLFPQIHNYSSLIEDEEGFFYTIYNQELLKLEFNTQTFSFDVVTRFNVTFPIDYKNCMVFDHDNNLWIGNETNGLFKFNLESENLEHFIHNELDNASISSNSIRSLFIDNKGVLWIGTANEGLNSYDLYRKKFYHYKSIPSDKNSLSSNGISSIHGISNDEVWVGLQGPAGVNRMVFGENEGLTVTHYKNDPNDINSLATNSITCLVQRKNGEVWAGGHENYVSRIIPGNLDNGEESIVERYYVGGWIFSMFEDSEEVLWIGTWGAGLFRFDDQTKECTNYKNDSENPASLPDDIVWSIYEDSYRNLWVGGNSKGFGILPADNKYSDKPEFINFVYDVDNPNSISSNSINCFYEDHIGNMWIGTIDGLNVVQGGEESVRDLKRNKDLTFFAFKEKDGLVGNGVMGILEDLDNNLWISTSNGISFFNVKDTIFTNYFESDGLQSNEFSKGASFINSNGMIFLGGKNGINAFNPKDIKANPFIPEIVLTDLKVFNKSVEVGEVINDDIILEKSINAIDEIVLSHLNNVFSIEFAALHFAQPGQNQYAYYLEGFEETWNYVDNENSTTYTNLSPGKYIFHVKGSNNNGVWNEEGKSLVIRVKPAWYNTWVFRIILLILIALVIIYSVKRKIEKTKQEKELLEEKIQQGERELEKRKDEIEKQKQEIEEQNKKEFEIKYLHTGVSKFSETISSLRDNVSELSNQLLNELINYTETEAGAIFLAEDIDSKDTKLINIASYCYDSSEISTRDFVSGEGKVGACFLDKEIIQMDNLPDGYIILSSGLGKTNLKYALLVPLLNGNICVGVMEIASLKKIESYKVELIKKLGENYTSVVITNRTSLETKNMLNQNKLQAEELKSKEEELRQNLEEMQATQEESKRQIEDYKQSLEKSNLAFEKIKKEIDEKNKLIKDLKQEIRNKSK